MGLYLVNSGTADNYVAEDRKRLAEEYKSLWEGIHLDDDDLSEKICALCANAKSRIEVLALEDSFKRAVVWAHKIPEDRLCKAVSLSGEIVFDSKLGPYFTHYDSPLYKPFENRLDEIRGNKKSWNEQFLDALSVGEQIAEMYADK